MLWSHPIRIYRVVFFVFAAAMLAGIPPQTRAAINPGGVVNAASFSPFGLPGSDIAPGSLFLVFGTDLAAPGLAQLDEFPLPSTLGGSSVQVEVGGRVVDCFMIFTTPGQIAVLLPSTTPVGVGVIRVTFNGIVSAGTIRVAASSVGIFSRNQAGSGPAIVQNFVAGGGTKSNTVFESATPGQAIIIWATGLGGVAGAEEQGPLPAVRPAGVTVRVIIAGREAQVVGFGRSGCCAGLDQITAFVPPDVNGCYASVQVVTEANGATTLSNTVSISVAPNGGACSDPGGVDVTQLGGSGGSGGEFKLGIISLGRGKGSLELPGLGSGSSSTDQVTGTFIALPSRVFDAALPLFANFQTGACTVTRGIGNPAPSIDPIPPRFLDAGPALTRTSPGGSGTVKKSPPGIYTELVVGETVINGEPVPQPGTGKAFLEPGTHTVSGPGGADIGAFSVSVEVGELVEWTNSDVTTIPRNADFTVTWTGGQVSTEVVRIDGSSAGTNSLGTRVSASFICLADPAAGRFTIPAYILGSLPATDKGPFGIAFGTLNVGTQTLPARFTAPNLDMGVVGVTTLTTRPTVAYE